MIYAWLRLIDGSIKCTVERGGFRACPCSSNVLTKNRRLGHFVDQFLRRFAPMSNVSLSLTLMAYPPIVIFIIIPILASSCSTVLASLYSLLTLCWKPEKRSRGRATVRHFSKPGSCSVRLEGRPMAWGCLRLHESIDTKYTAVELHCRQIPDRAGCWCVASSGILTKLRCNRYFKVFLDM